MNETTAPPSPVTLLNFSWSRPLPMIRQSEAAECGLACLAMVAGFHGLHTDLTQLRYRFRLSSQGSNLKTLIDIAANMQLAGRALKADLNAIGQLQLPCVLHSGAVNSFRRGHRLNR